MCQRYLLTATIKTQTENQKNYHRANTFFEASKEIDGMLIKRQKYSQESYHK